MTSESTPQPIEYSTEVPALYKQHYKHLYASGISADVMKERGYRTITDKDQLEAAGFFNKQRNPGLIIPVWGVDGKRVYNLLRPDKPRVSRSTRADGSVKENILKYEHPKDVGIHLDVHPRCLKHIGNPNIPLHIVEGLKKEDAVISAGADCVVGISGVYGWRGTNSDGGKTVLEDWERVALNGRDVYVSMDSDLWSNINIGKAYKGLKGYLTYKKAKVHVIKYPVGADGNKVGADDFLAAGHTLPDIYALETAEQPNGAKEIIHQGLEDFLQTDVKSGFQFIQENGKGVLSRSIANFVCAITEEIEEDDGLTREKYYRIEGMMLETKKRLPPITIPVGKLKSLSWIDEQWGISQGPYLFSGIGRGVEEQFVTHIKRASVNVPLKKKYKHTGWRLIDGKWEYLTAAGALGNPNVYVELNERLRNYRIPTPEPATDFKAAMMNSLEFMDIGATKESRRFLMPLWAEMYLAPLCSFAKPNFATWMYGESGCFKSTVAALAICHFGTFTDTTLPANFLYTGNAMEQLSSWAADIPLVDDDWNPGDNTADAQKMEAEAGRINRTQGNLRGRGRFVKPGEQEPVYTPRGLLIITAEQLPRGQSNNARFISLKMRKGDVDLDKLSEAQRLAVDYKKAMAGYLYWIRNKWTLESWDDVEKSELQHRLTSYRHTAYKELQSLGLHQRIPQMISFVYIGLELGLNYAVELGALSPSLLDLSLTEGWTYLLDIAKEQAQRVQKEKACKRFLEASKIILFSGSSRIDDKDSLMTPTDAPGITFMGWSDEEYFYLWPKKIFKAVFDFYQRMGEVFTIKEQTLWDELWEMQLLSVKPSEEKENNRTTSERFPSLHGNARVLKLKKEALFEPEATESEGQLI